MSEYYTLRRRKITDAMALLGFIAGLIIPAYSAGVALAEGFEIGDESGGLTYFVVRILGSAFAGGFAGLLLGIAGGWIWEQIHRRTRRDPDADAAVAAGINPGETLSAELDEARAWGRQPVAAKSAGGAHSRTPSVPDASIRFDNAGFGSVDFMRLMRRVVPGNFDDARSAAALEHTRNLGAWDGERLVGSVRLLTDGYFSTTIPDLMVDPDYRRRGIGRELMRRAVSEAGTGVIMPGVPPEAMGFFEHIGWQRAPSGYFSKRRTGASEPVQ